MFILTVLKMVWMYNNFWYTLKLRLTSWSDGIAYHARTTMPRRELRVPGSVLDSAQCDIVFNFTWHWIQAWNLFSVCHLRACCFWFPGWYIQLQKATFWDCIQQSWRMREWTGNLNVWFLSSPWLVETAHKHCFTRPINRLYVLNESFGKSKPLQCVITALT